MKKVYCGILFIGFIAAGMTCVAQDNTRSANRKIMQESQEAVDAIAMYPRGTREIIFEASEYPEVITKLNAMQKNSQAAFAALISSFSKNEQEKIWNLTRYDYLISDLASSPKKSTTEINNLLVNYPVEIHKTALQEQKKNYNVLVQIDQMNKSYDADFDLLLKNYPPEAVNAFRQIIQMPEVLGILTDNMPYTVLVGQFYKKNPDRILHKTDSLNLALTQKNNLEAEDWKKSMNDDPDAQKEFVQAAQEYAQENGYQPDMYNAPMTEFDTNYSSNSYNWWFGYPTWYPENSWNPNPYWYDWGFYFGPGKQAVFTGLPSSYFMDWYFYYPKHFSKYAELSNHYYDYYDRHSGSMNYNSVSRSVNNWRNNNKDIVTKDWSFDKTNRVERFRQYGNMEVSRKNYNNRNPKQQIGRTEYVQRTPNKYYFLAADVSKTPEIQRNTRTTSVQENQAKPARRPTVTLPEHYNNTSRQSNNNTSRQQENNTSRQRDNMSSRQPASVNTQPANTVSRQRQTTVSTPSRNTNTTRPVENSQMRNAVQYNQNAWKQPQQPQQQTQQTQQTQPQQNRTSPSTREPEIRQTAQPARQNNPAPSNDRKR